MEFGHDNTYDLLSDESTAESELKPPLYTSSAVNPPWMPRFRKHDPQRKLMVLSFNYSRIKSEIKKSEFHSLVGLRDPTIILGCEI